MGGLEHWQGGSRDTSVVLIEGRGIQLSLDGDPLNSLLLSYPKYPLLVLAANIAPHLGGRMPTILDLKGPQLQRPPRGNLAGRAIKYEGRELAFCEVGMENEELRQHLTGANVVCVSCNYTMERGAAGRLLSFIRRIEPHVLIVVGGHDPTVAPGPYLQAGADICVLGEGETVFGEILLASSGDELLKIHGIAYATGGGVKRNGKRPVHSLDRIHYPGPAAILEASGAEYPDGPWPEGVGPRFMVLETSRGCDEACGFCSSTFVTGRFRSWSLDGMIAQVARVGEAGVRTLLIADDNLLYRMLPEYGGERGRAELIRFFSWLRANGFSWTFYNGLQFGLLEAGGKIDDELIKALFASSRSQCGLVGCFEAYIPLERFDKAEAALLPKLRPPEVQRELLRAIAAQQVHQLNLGFIVGAPCDSRDTLASFFEHAQQLGQMTVHESDGMSRVRHLPWCSVPLPGTPNRSRYRTAIRYDLELYPELHSNYVSVIEGVDATPLDFTLGRKWLDQTLNASMKTPAECSGA